MILVTVGGQMAFDRLIAAVDAWAARTPGADVLAQIGPSALTPKHLRCVAFMEPDAFRASVAGADVVVAHAGMGTILTALEHGKPILVMPRLGALRETRNDHQVATAKRFLEMGRVHVAMDATELAAQLDRLGTLRPAERISAGASEELLRTLREFVHARR